MKDSLSNRLPCQIGPRPSVFGKLLLSGQTLPSATEPRPPYSASCSCPSFAYALLACSPDIGFDDEGDGASGGGSGCSAPPPLRQFSGGDGSSANPFLICTPYQLERVAADLAGNYILGQDIDLDNRRYTESVVDVRYIFPKEFTGTFDGRGYKIQNLRVEGSGTAPANGDAALFRELASGGMIQNVGIENVDISTQETGSLGFEVRVASLVALQSGGTIRNCYMSDSDGDTDVQGDGGRTWVGGLVGEQRGGEIIGSYAEGELRGGSGFDSVGGLVGEQSGGVISDSYAAGEARGDGWY